MQNIPSAPRVINPIVLYILKQYSHPLCLCDAPYILVVQTQLCVHVSASNKPSSGCI